MRFRPEPPHSHGTPARAGVVLVNLGTPQAPSAAALRPYLKQFLSDPRVVEIPRALWWLVLNAVVLNVRPRKSARKYAAIWTDEGSSLAVHTRRQAALLQQVLTERTGVPVEVVWAMRYGSPSIDAALAQLARAGCDRVLVVPMYPQYAASTTASTYDAVFESLRARRNLPALRLLKHFHDDPGYIAALARSVREHWQAHGRGDRLVMSFHGLPRLALDRGDPYHCECHKTGRLLAQALDLSEDQYVVSFQSRFGAAQWLQPYTQDTLEGLARKGVRHLDVICPGFVADCLETLEEIALENRTAFLAAGGTRFHYIDCLNERPDWIAALADIALANLQGWLRPDDATEGQETRRRALALGATD
ncbi:MAG: ferrochelatase [Burkholderiales bacterium]|nr:ferrochelatase [Burkholderiales bacterium]